MSPFVQLLIVIGINSIVCFIIGFATAAWRYWTDDD